METLRQLNFLCLDENLLAYDTSVVDSIGTVQMMCSSSAEGKNNLIQIILIDFAVL